jgi:hypothetical protein
VTRKERERTIERALSLVKQFLKRLAVSKCNVGHDVAAAQVMEELKRLEESG